MSDCQYPDLNEHQHQVITGLLMGDASLERGSKNPRLEIEMVTKPYIEYLDSNVFGLLSTGVSKKRTSEESALNARESGLNPEAKADDYNNVYRMVTRRLPELKIYAEWYSTDEKVFPGNISFSPTTLLHWFVGDGSYKTSGYDRRITISLCNEADNKEKINRYFKDGPQVEVSNWYIGEQSYGNQRAQISFTVDATEKLFDYMDQSPDPTPPPGFKYKWPEEYR